MLPFMNRPRQIALDAAFVVAMFTIVVSWFSTSLLGHRALLLLVALTVLAGLARMKRGVPSWRPHASTLIVCGLGIALRAPAFIEPAGFVGSDGSLQAMLVNGILGGVRPAPVFLETSTYQGSLKAHLGALASLALGRDDLALLVVVASTGLWTLFTASIMALGRRLGGTVPAAGAGLFVALSPRFATIFSISNVGEYPDALGLGVLAMAWTAKILAEDRFGFETRWAFFGIGWLLGIAFWQQPIVVSSGAVVFGLLGFRAMLRRDSWFLASVAGAVLGRLPVTIHDLHAASGNNQVLGGFLRTAGQSLPFIDHVKGTLGWGLPVVFTGLASDSKLEERTRVAIGLACMAVFAWFAARAGRELKAAYRERSWAMARVMGALSFIGALAFVWLVAGGGQYTRPRYFLSLLPGFALALGDLAFVLWSRSRPLALAAGVLVIGSNASSNLDRMRSGLAAGQEARALAERIEQLHLQTGYSSVTFAGPLIMLTHERVSVDGVLKTEEGQRLPARHLDRVRTQGPDFYLVEPGEAADFARRLEEKGVSFKREGSPLPQTLFYGFSRRVVLTEVQD